MNRSVILIQLLITSGLSNPIDTTIPPSDESVSKVDDSQVIQPPVHVAVNDNDENGLVSKTIDSIISNSEIIKVNSVDKIVEDKHYIKALEEEDKHGLEIKSIESTNEPANRNIVSSSEPETKISTSTQSLHVEEKKAIEIESVTSMIEDDTTDYLESPIDSSIDSKTALEEESKSMKSESIKASDESNDDWDVLDDLILTRRMMSDLEDYKKDTISEIIPGKVKPKTAEPQDKRQSIPAQDEKVKSGKGNNNVQIIHLPNISHDPTKGPLYQPDGLPSYFVKPAKTNAKPKEESTVYTIMEYPSGIATRRNFGQVQKPLDYKERTRIQDHIPIKFPMTSSYTSPLLQNPINKSAYILSKLLVASEQPFRNGRRMNKNTVGLSTPKFLNINLPNLASSCGVTRACALFTI